MQIYTGFQKESMCKVRSDSETAFSKNTCSPAQRIAKVSNFEINSRFEDRKSAI
jgi:hypothetical protein